MKDKKKIYKFVLGVIFFQPIWWMIKVSVKAIYKEMKSFRIEFSKDA